MLEFRTIVCDGTLSRSGVRASLVGKDGTMAAHVNAAILGTLAQLSSADAWLITPPNAA